MVSVAQRETVVQKDSASLAVIFDLFGPFDVLLGVRSRSKIHSCIDPLGTFLSHESVFTTTDREMQIENNVRTTIHNGERRFIRVSISY
jgi:hypothetical protein